MKKKLIPVLLAALLPASALLAQQTAPAPAAAAAPTEVEEDVVGTLDANDAKIAIPAFATNADVPT